MSREDRGLVVIDDYEPGSPEWVAKKIVDICVLCFEGGEQNAAVEIAVLNNYIRLLEKELGIR